METVEVRPASEKPGEAKQPVTPQPEKPKRKPGRPPSGTGPGRPPSGTRPGRPPSGTRPGRPPSGTRSTPVDADFKKLRLHNSLASLLANLKKELRLRSDSDTVHWLLHKARPDLVRSPPAGSPRPPRPAPESVPPVYFSYSDGGEESASDSPVVAGSDPLGKPPVRATVVQASSVFFDTPVTLEKAERLVSGAAAYGSQLVVFPEAFIGGYPRGIVFDTAAATHSTGQETDYQKYYASAINVPGPEVERLAKIASKFKVHLVMGVVERAGSYLYSTVLLFDSLGRPLGQQRKQMLMASESGVWNSGEKLSPPVFKTSIGKVGGLLCWDNRSPLLRTELYTKGVEIYCAPTADGREVWQASVTHIALEGSCFVLSANQFCHRQDHPIASRDSNGGESVDVITCGGGSVIVSPSGTILAGPNYQGECLISADLDFGEIARAKKDFGEIRSNVGPTANGSNSVFFERDKKTEVPDQPSWCQYMVPTPTGSCLAV